MQAERQGSVSPFMLLQAFGTLVSDRGEPLNGETSQDAEHFVDQLLHRLENEEAARQEDDADKVGFVRELFGVKTGALVSLTSALAICRKTLTHRSWVV